MRLTIAVHGHLRETSAIGQDEVTFTLPDAGSLRVRDILEILNIFEEEVKDVTINGRKGRVDSGLHGRTKLEIYAKDRARR
jgi:hypothetical protein